MIILWSEGHIAKKMVFEVPHIKPRDMFGVDVGEVAVSMDNGKNDMLIQSLRRMCNVR